MSSSSDHDRQIGNGVLFGVVTELDEAGGLVRVDVDGMVTDWIPWAERNSGPGVREWSAYEVGEQVVVLSPYGDPSQGVVVGAIPCDAYPQPANVKTKRRTEWVDGAFVEYDREAQVMHVDVPTAGQIKLHVGGSTLTFTDGKVTLETPELLVDSPKSTFTGEVIVQGHFTGQSAADITGDCVITGGDVKADAFTLKTHKHSAVTAGTGVSGPSVP